MIMRKIIVLALLALCSYQVAQPMNKRIKVSVGSVNVFLAEELMPYTLKIPQTNNIKDIIKAKYVSFALEAVLFAAGVTTFGVGFVKSIQSNKKLKLLNRIRQHLLVDTLDAKTLQTKEVRVIALEIEKFTPKELKILQAIIKHKESEQQIKHRQILWGLLSIGGITLSIGTLYAAALTYTLAQKSIIKQQQAIHKKAEDNWLKKMAELDGKIREKRLAPENELWREASGAVVTLPENTRLDQSLQRAQKPQDMTTQQFNSSKDFTYFLCKKIIFWNDCSKLQRLERLKILGINEIVDNNGNTIQTQDLFSNTTNETLANYNRYEKQIVAAIHLKYLAYQATLNPFEERQKLLKNWLYGEDSGYNNRTTPNIWKVLDVEKFEDIFKLWKNNPDESFGLTFSYNELKQYLHFNYSSET